MKTLIFHMLIIAFVLLYSSFRASQTEIKEEICEEVICVVPEALTDTTQEFIPYHLREGFGETIYETLAVVYVDFPDGRVNGTEQVFHNEQLDEIANLDAVAELGIDSIENDLKKVPAKYTYFDRWDMYFSEDTYYGQVHPDYNAYGDSAYGSVKEWFKETSNNKYIIVPANTHPERSGDERLKTGIINKDTVINDRNIIKSIRLPKNKFGQNGYFPTINSFAYHDELREDALKMLDSLYDIGEIEFDRRIFTGSVAIVFAGGSCCIGGQADGEKTFTTRGTTFNFRDTTKFNRMDGIRILLHEMGHNRPFNFKHTNCGRYCTMNQGSSSLHRDCPAQFSAPLKIKMGWVEPIFIENSQSIDNLEPIETSGQVGIITIYGKPSASEDFDTGEYFIVENRRLTGFDYKINNINGFGNSSFKGGLLIYHYSPYTFIPGNSNDCNNYLYYHPEFKLELPRFENTDMCGNLANQDNFFGFDGNSGTQFFNLDSNRTYSSVVKKTGIKIANITQSNTPTSGISFNVNYLLEEPVQYDYVMQRENTSPEVVNLSGNVYYHSKDGYKYYNVLPGTIIEIAPLTYSEVKGFEAHGTTGQPITIRGCGYSTYKILHPGLIIRDYDSYQSIDSIVLDNITIQNPGRESDIALMYPEEDIPFKFNNLNLQTSDYNSEPDISLVNGNGNPATSLTVNGLSLDYYKLKLEGDEINILNDINLKSSKLILSNTSIKIAQDIPISLTESNLIGIVYEPGRDYIKLNKFNDQGNWRGIFINNGNAILNGIKLNNSNYGVYLTMLQPDVEILNSKFENNAYNDIFLYDNMQAQYNINIKGNNFYCSSNESSSIVASDIINLTIDSNYFYDVNTYGITLLNTTEPYIRKNILDGINSSNYSSGILSYNSNGFYDCNLLYNFNDYAILLDNSSPYMFSNEMYGNGIGLFLTNYSYPILSPSFLPSETIYNAGLNRIHHNGGEEIYCNNLTEDNISIPLMYKGDNMIEDESDVLIQNEYFDNPSYIIEGNVNYWGGSEPVGRFNPEGCVDYSGYLTSNPTTECATVSISENNSGLNSELLLMGEAATYLRNGSFENSEAKFKQIINNNPTEGLKIFSANKIFDIYSLSNYSFNILNNYYSQLLSSQSNTPILRNLRDLKIETKIFRELFSDAVNDYNSIINNSSDSVEIFYANLNKIRVLNFLLDSLYEGDNFGINSQLRGLSLEELYIKKMLTQNSHKSNLKFAKTQKNSLVTSGSKLNSLIDNYRQMLSHNNISNNLNDLLIRKLLVSLTEINVKNDIPQKDIKLAYMNKSTNTNEPLTFKLFQNYPNPFNPITKINFSVPKNVFVKLKVYDITGKEISVLVNEEKSAGYYSYEFSGKNLSSGIYFYKLITDSFVESKRMVLVK